MMTSMRGSSGNSRFVKRQKVSAGERRTREFTMGRFHSANQVLHMKQQYLLEGFSSEPACFRGIPYIGHKRHRRPSGFMNGMLAVTLPE